MTLDERLALRLDELRDAGYGEEAEALESFLEDQEANGLSYQRQRWYLTHLHHVVTDYLRGHFLKPTKEGMKRAVAAMRKAQKAKGRLPDNYLIAIKRFYRWHLGEDEAYPPEVAWIRTTPTGNNNDWQPLSEEEMARLVQAADHPRDRALVALLVETGATIEEALNVQVQDLRHDGGKWRVLLRGEKHNERRFPLMQYTAHVVAWRDAYREEADPEPEDSLFPALTTRGGGVRRPIGPLKTGSARRSFHRIVARAELNEEQSRVHFHLLRKSRATILAKDLPEHALEVLMGWVPGSRMAANYVRMSGRDAEEALERAGWLPSPPRRERRPCPWCGEENAPYVHLCNVCGRPMLPEEEAREVRERMRQEFQKEASVEVGRILDEMRTWSAKDTSVRMRQELSGLRELVDEQEAAIQELRAKLKELEK